MKISLAASMMAGKVKYDQENGLGNIPYNNMRELRSRGLRVLMKPDVFLTLAAPLERHDADSVEYIKTVLQDANGRGIGSPILRLQFERDKNGDLFAPRVLSHEGRNRAYAVKELYGPQHWLLVHLIFDNVKPQQVTHDVLNRIRWMMVSEKGKPIHQPEELFKIIKQEWTE